MHAQTACASRRRYTRYVALIWLPVLLLIGSPAFAQAPQPGLANTFEIDGNLISNSPGGIIGLGDDWLNGPAGPGTGLLNPDGTPKNPATTVHIIDLVKKDLTVFATATKVFADPNTYGWKEGSTPQKDDIQNGLMHFTEDALGDHWMIVAGDRKTITGDSYIDFEFLQNTLLKNADGTFTSMGPDGGRTVGDILLTIHLSNGGNQAEFFAQKWVSNGDGGYTYVDIPFPTGVAFVAANVDSSVVTSFDAFGGNVYGTHQFGEAAVNLDKLLPEFGSCFGVATVFVRTKSSTSEDAVLKDFIEPYQVNICLDETPPQLECPADITVSCGTPTDPVSIGSAFATDNCDADPAVSYSDSVATDNCSSSYRIFRTWIARDNCGNLMADTQIITVVDNTPPVILYGPGPVTVDCPEAIPPADGTLVVARDDCGVVSVSHLGDVPNGDACNQTITRTYRVDDGCGNTTDFVQTITVKDETAPEITGAPDNLTVGCSSEIPDDDIRLITATDNCGTPTVRFAGDVSDGKSCPETITRTYEVSDACGNKTTVQQTITVKDETAPEITGAPGDLKVQCADHIPLADIQKVKATDNCGGVTITCLGDVSDANSCPETITRTYRATDACGNYTEIVQTITVNDDVPPEITKGLAPVRVQCTDEVPPPTPGSIGANDNCSDVTIVFVDDVSDGNTCSETISRTYRVYDACLNTTEVVQTITIEDDVPPQLTSCGSSTNLECPPLVKFTPPTATDNCDPDPEIELAASDSTIGPEPWTYTVSRTWRAVDDCGNRSTSCSQTLTVHCEVDVLCTFTQGFYGNYGGHFNGMSTLEIVEALLSSSPLVVGKDGRSLKIRRNAAYCIIERLPAGTTPRSLPDIGNANMSHTTCQTSPEIPLDSQGKFENVLLGQVITLSLNTRFSPWLSFFPLTETFCTQRALPGPDGYYGTDDDVLNEKAPVQQFNIPVAVLEALDAIKQPRVVAGLLELANRALAAYPSQDLGGATIPEINAACDAINRGFDGCRFIVDCQDLAKDNGDWNRFTGSEFEGADGGTPVAPDRFELGQNYPNPFNPTTRITLATPTATSWSIGIYDVAGKLVRRFEGESGGPSNIDIQWDGRDAAGRPAASGVYFYRAQAGTFRAVRKMVLMK